MTRLTKEQQELLDALDAQPAERLYAKTLKPPFDKIAYRLVELGVLELGAAPPPGTKWLPIYRRSNRPLNEDEYPCE